MTKIGMKAAVAFNKMHEMIESNTVVQKFDGAWEVRLFGNKIASRSMYNVFSFSLCGWSTQTTCDRLNAIFSELNCGFRISLAGGAHLYEINAKRSVRVVGIDEDKTYVFGRTLGEVLEDGRSVL